MTEFNAATGALVQIIGGPQYKFDQPALLASWGPDLFVFSLVLTTRSAVGSITQIGTNAPTGSSAPTTTTLPSTTPAPVVATSTTTTTSPTSSTTPIAPATTEGSSSTPTTISPPPTADIVRIITGPPYGLGESLAATVVGDDLYVANLGAEGSDANGSLSTLAIGGAGSVVEINAQSGTLVRNYSTGSCHIDEPEAFAAAGDQLLVSNAANNTVSELSTVSGECGVATVGSDYDFDDPAAMVVAHGHLVVGGVPVSDLFSGVGLASYGSFASEMTEINPSTGALVRVLKGAEYKLGLFGALAASGKDVFVANFENGITEINADTGRLVRVIGVGKPGTLATTALAVSGKYLLVGVLNKSDTGSLMEIDIATGSLVKTISGKRYGLSIPVSLATVGPDVFMDTVNDDNSSSNITSTLTEIDMASGQLVRVISGAGRGIRQTIDIVADGSYIFALNVGSLTSEGEVIRFGPGTIAQIDAENGALVRLISGPRYDLSGATAMAVMGRDLYIADAGANAVTEIDPATGALVKLLDGDQYSFVGPDGEATWGHHLYVANGQGNSVTDIDLGP